MEHRFIEAEDRAKTNHGKFSLCAFQSKERAYVSAITNERLLSGLPAMRRFETGITRTTLLLMDLQTQEGMMFDPAQTPEIIRRRFLVHPLHVCLLYFPLMIHLHRHQHEIWKLPPRVVLDLDDVLAQPGVLVDRDGVPVKARREWSARCPLSARLRNRELPIEEDGQGVLTIEELAEHRLPAPTW